MKTEKGLIKCDCCGRFTNKFYRYIPYGHSYDTEPPEEEELCEACYNNSDKKLLEKISWIKPYLVC